MPPDERRKHHQSRLRSIAFYQGADGVAEYRRLHPDAAATRVTINTLAYTAKPSGYADYLANMVETWLASDTALAETNRADVERLNARFGPGRFNPANHFSKPLSPSVFKKLQALLARHGIELDTAKANTMAKVRKAVKAAKAHAAAGRPFGKVGTINGATLTIGRQCFAIMQHHGRESIKLTIAGERVWLRLDAAVEFIALAGLVPAEQRNPSHSSSLKNRRTGPEPDFDPLEADPESSLPIGELVPAPSAPPDPGDSLPTMGELVPDDPGRRPLAERIAAIRADQDAAYGPRAVTADCDRDPLDL